MTADLQSSGISPAFIETLLIMVRIGEISEASSLSTIGLMLSGPAALCGFKFFNNFPHQCL